MKNYIKHALDELTKKFPNWDTDVLKYLENDKKDGKEAFDRLTEILLQVVSQIRDKNITKEELEKIFSDYKQFNCFDHIISFVWNRVSVYTDYSLLRESCQSDKYLAQKIFDIIWDENIYRFNPYLNWNEKLKLNYDDSLFDNLVERLNRYVTRCVRFSLTFDAMVEGLKKDSDLPDEMCRYIAKKIDENMKELKLNFILERLIRMEDNIDAMLSDDSSEE